MSNNNAPATSSTAAQDEVSQAAIDAFNAGATATLGGPILARTTDDTRTRIAWALENLQSAVRHLNEAKGAYAAKDAEIMVRWALGNLIQVNAALAARAQPEGN